MTKCALLLVLFVSTLVQAKEVTGIRCYVNDMPSDGGEREFILTKDSATYTTTYNNRWEGQLVTTTQAMVREGECKFNPKTFVGGCREKIIHESGDEEMRFIDMRTVSERFYHFDEGTEESYTRVLINYVTQPAEEGSQETEIEFSIEDCSPLKK